MPQNLFRVGCGAGFSGDRLDVAEPVVDSLIAAGDPSALIFETLAERTLALAQLARQSNPNAGYEPSLEPLLRPVLAKCVGAGIPIVGNFGAANPPAAAECVLALGRSLGLSRLRVAVVAGDDIRTLLQSRERGAIDCAAAGNAGSDNALLAANVYLGIEPIVEGLAGAADVVITGRVADPSLALAPLAHHFNWASDDWDLLAAGTLAGHLLECGSQVSGGYVADPGYKDIPDLANVGFPIAEVEPDGAFVITKPEHSGGLVDLRTVKEQLLYEIHDPAAYLTPDVVLDLTAVTATEVAGNRVRVQGARGKPRPPTLKATLCNVGGWLGEAEISYAGPNALARAELAAAVVAERLQRQWPELPRRIDLIGAVSVLDGDGGGLSAALVDNNESRDIRLRLAVDAPEEGAARSAIREVLSLYCTGPAGGGGVRQHLTSRIKTESRLIPRQQVAPRVQFLEL